MTLEEAIKHAEEVADEKKKDACNLYDAKSYEESRECIWCAEEHRQLAEWLKDYKRLLEPKTGHWISTRNAENVGVLRCSICGFINEWGIDRRGKGTYNFCPNCGVRMVEPQESEE